MDNYPAHRQDHLDHRLHHMHLQLDLDLDLVDQDSGQSNNYRFDVLHFRRQFHLNHYQHFEEVFQDALRCAIAQLGGHWQE